MGIILLKDPTPIFRGNLVYFTNMITDSKLRQYAIGDANNPLWYGWKLLIVPLDEQLMFTLRYSDYIGLIEDAELVLNSSGFGKVKINAEYPDGMKFVTTEILLTPEAIKHYQSIII